MKKIITITLISVLLTTALFALGNRETATTTYTPSTTVTSTSNVSGSNFKRGVTYVTDEKNNDITPVKLTFFSDGNFLYSEFPYTTVDSYGYDLVGNDIYTDSNSLKEVFGFKWKIGRVRWATISNDESTITVTYGGYNLTLTRE